MSERKRERESEGERERERERVRESEREREGKRVSDGRMRFTMVCGSFWNGFDSSSDIFSWSIFLELADNGVLREAAPSLLFSSHIIGARQRERNTESTLYYSQWLT